MMRRSSQRTATQTTCKCGLAILQGLDHDVAACTARVDPTPINPADEQQLIESGRYTYTARQARDGIELWFRNDYHRRGTPTHPIHVNHVCPHTVQELPL